MKKTIKKLEEELEEERNDARTVRNRLYETERELNSIRNDRAINLERNFEREIDLSKNLLEIIRWMVNPETAKSPFNPTKDERDDRR